MSGIVGLVRLDGGGADTVLLEGMTRYLNFRGPDRVGIWTEGSVGFGHALLGTTPEKKKDRQPRTLDGQVWITADVRIDGQAELRRQLDSVPRRETENGTDAELVLEAYLKWGENCVDHLLGDFAFAIWDGRRKALFCARDQIGVKPFYYACNRQTLVFSNTLNCLRTHPEITETLNDEAVADFLLFGFMTRSDQSVFSDIHRLSPGHALTWSPTGGLICRPYWSPPVPDPVRYRRDMDVIEGFDARITDAVRDRLPTDTAFVLMSGGLDSTTIAAVARSLDITRTLFALTAVYDRFLPDRERHYSELAAEYLRIPVHHVSADRDPLWLDWAGKRPTLPEPIDEPVLTRSALSLLERAGDARVGLTGNGGDPALHPAASHLPAFIKELVNGRLPSAALHYRWTEGRWPRIEIRKSLRRWLGKKRSGEHPPIPPWLNRDLSNRLDLSGRWRRHTEGKTPAQTLRSVAVELTFSPLWSRLFEMFDPGVTAAPIELRHPYFDLRVLSFLLALPPIPWCTDKTLLRKAMKNRLPDPLLRRPKTPMGVSPVHERLQKISISDINSWLGDNRLAEYVDPARFRTIAENPQGLRPQETPLITRPLSLAIWLSQPNPEKFSGDRR